MVRCVICVICMLLLVIYTLDRLLYKHEEEENMEPKPKSVFFVSTFFERKKNILLVSNVLNTQPLLARMSVV